MFDPARQIVEVGLSGKPVCAVLHFAAINRDIHPFWHPGCDIRKKSKNTDFKAVTIDFGDARRAVGELQTARANHLATNNVGRVACIHIHQVLIGATVGQYASDIDKSRTSQLVYGGLCGACRLAHRGSDQCKCGNKRLS
ncbi:hypothetical protein [Shimia sagamensis]|uniref:Uncharacterized protein n=1 Tax=Shimia sagamensis TaxID=1566352 RepID=A0ABY1NYU0_9RHOB|nr:hypothetical protein [Shimia sagamensis]SMP22269.1 hypothetical protein SAMN06265373_104147 [Shimia sagamensis]